VQNKAVRQTPRKAINKKISWAEDSDLAEDKADVVVAMDLECRTDLGVDFRLLVYTIKCL
jgi:hypothetical protein